MGDSLSKIVAIIIGVFLLFIYPISNMFERQDDITRIFVLAETTKLVDSVRNLGYITPTMYLEFSNNLAATNNLYDIQMEHRRKVYDPLYDDPTIPSTFKDTFNINYTANYTEDIMETLFPDPPNTDGKYTFSKGDYFLVKVTNRNKTIATRIHEMLYATFLSTEKIIVKYGGMIKDEDY
ncbi:hypothetical protein [Alkaliphilus serpentinus]|uniref:Uncharacterized protein n=1 Tax=Alkaliphilus serpentinus TaxID=1482731 RepID=A0A833HL87_9FIRM|nr:hypothetical protein [Alkaliphilus serpentinus]KAB3525460.1 hypothetical protein F8153_15355 [Alkaliphilus serpentinus]